MNRPVAVAAVPWHFVKRIELKQVQVFEQVL